MRRRCKTFEEWARSQYNEFFATWRKSKYLGYNFDSKKSVAVIYNLRSGKTASASANLQRVYGIENVIGLAWADYKDETIPDFWQSLSSLYDRDEILFRLNCKEWQIIQRNPHNSEELICACENGEVKSFNTSILVRRV